MPTSTGPNTKGEENLVFGYDLGDVSNSYKGEPTTNIVPSPQNNSRFTTDNTWYTYNTAQYNGATYFSIGTVGSVSNNEVTLSSVGRTLYTYDVLTPQTTGGGVSAGTNYMVKKTGTNTFTLHAYNGSQNGSQGYRDPVTGAFKVHESVALDQRVSINATDFPTMWWGPPHLPNMCFVKEVVPSGGPNDNSSFMRIHLTRPAGTDGGMAYGVYPQVTQGDLITVSFWARSSVNSNWSWSTYFNAGFSAPGFGINSTTEWQRFEYSWTASNTFGFYMYFWPGNPGFVPYYVDLADIQVEVNKGHATSFTLSSRSATQGLLDLTGNSTIDLTNVSFDSSAQITFDGTNDTISVASYPAIELVDNVSIEYVYRRLSTDPILDVIANKYHSTGWELFCTATNKFALAGRNGDGTYYSMSNGAYTIQNNQYYHLVAIKEGLSWRLYVNGELYAYLTANTVGTWSNTGVLQIGGEGNGYYPNMQLPILKIYNKVLSASEIQQNFNAIKGRFNI